MKIKRNIFIKNTISKVFERVHISLMKAKVNFSEYRFHGRL